MNISSLALFLAVSLSVVYVILAIVAFTHVDKSKTAPLASRLLALTFWWPFYDLYDNSARRVCFFGRIILPAAVAAYVIWLTN
jgi:hypothetical protein